MRSKESESERCDMDGQNMIEALSKESQEEEEREEGDEKEKGGGGEKESR